MSIRPLLTILLLALPCSAVAQSPQPKRAPDWTCTPSDAIEWAALAGPAARPNVVIATRAGEVQLIDVDAAEPAPTAPVRVAPGVQSVSRTPAAPDDVVYCYDRYAIYALNAALAPDQPEGRPVPVAGALRWQHGELPADPTAFRDDPETLTGWLAVASTPAGVLGLNRDGRVCLLSHADGHVLWDLSLEPMTVARLHTLDDEAVILWKAGTRTKAAFLRLTAARPTPTVRDAGDIWPLWSTLYSGGLLTVIPIRVTVWTPTESPRRIALRAVGLSAGTIDIFVPPAQPASAPLLLVGDGANALAIDLTSGTRRWPTIDIHGSGYDIETLRCIGDQVVLTYDVGVYSCDVQTGRRTAYLADASQEYVGVDIARRRLCAVHRDGDKPGAPLKLTMVPLMGISPRTVTSRATPACELETGGSVRQVLWTARRLLVIESDAVRAFSLSGTP